MISLGAHLVSRWLGETAYHDSKGRPKSEAVKDKRGPTKGRRDSRGAEEPGGRHDHEEIEHGEKSGSSQKLEKSGKVETEKAEKAEKPEKAERIEKPEKIEKVDKPEKLKKIQRPERPDDD